MKVIRAFFKSRESLETLVRTALLIGLLSFGICGIKLVSNNKEGRCRYICRKETVTTRGRGGVKITYDLVEDFIAQAILTRFNYPEMERSLTQAKPNPRSLATHSGLSGLDSRFIELAEMVAEREFTRVQYQAAMKVATDRKGELERTLAKERGVLALSRGLGSPQMIAQKWQTLNLDRQKAILKSILESIQVIKVIEKGMPFNPARIRLIWKY